MAVADVEREEPAVRRAEVDARADDERRRLDLRVLHAQLPERASVRARGKRSPSRRAELTITRLPAIAGVDGFGARERRVQIVLPVSASSAHVTPPSVFA